MLFLVKCQEKKTPTPYILFLYGYQVTLHLNHNTITIKINTIHTQLELAMAHSIYTGSELN